MEDARSKTAALLREREMLQRQLAEMQALQQQLEMATQMSAKPRVQIQEMDDNGASTMEELQRFLDLGKKLDDLKRFTASVSSTGSNESEHREVVPPPAVEKQSQRYSEADYFMNLLKMMQESNNEVMVSRDEDDGIDDGNVRAAQGVLQQVMELRDEIVAMKERGDDDESWDEELANLAEKLQALEQTKRKLYHDANQSSPAQARGRHNTQASAALQTSRDEQSVLSQEEMLLIALEEAKQMQRSKSLQLKRQEQEVANLQRSVQLLEGKIVSLRPDLADEIHRGPAADTQSSVAVEASSVRSSEFSQDDGDDDDDDNSDDDDEEEESEDETEDEKQIEEIRSLGTNGNQGSIKNHMRSIEETSITAHAGSVAGDIFDAGYESKPTRRAESKEGGFENRSIDISSMRTTLYASNTPLQSISIISNPFVDAADCSIIMDELSDLVCHIHTRYTGRSRSERETGRRVVNFISKLLDEFRDVDITRLDQQRAILQSIRSTANDFQHR